jgi:hypothetical protein
VIAAEAAPLCSDPAVEGWVAVDLQALKKIAGEQRGELLQPFRLSRRNGLRRLRDLDCIDEAVGQIEPDGVRPCLDPALTICVNQAPDLAEAPAQFSARVVGDVPCNSQSWLRATARGDNDRYAKSPRTLRDAGSGSVTPSRRIVSGPSMRTSIEGSPRTRSGRADSMGISTPYTTVAPTCGH